MLLPLALLFVQSIVSIDDAPPPIEGYLDLEHITTVEVSTDGRSVAFIVQAVSGDSYTSTLHTWERRTGVQALAATFTDVRSPGWSPDGEWLVFIAKNPAAPSSDAPDQLWALPRFTDEPLHLSEISSRIIEFGWTPDGSLLVLTEEEPGDLRSFWRLRIRQGEAERIWEGDPGIRDMAVSPDGRMIAFSSNGSATPENFLNYDIWLLDIEGARARRLTSRAGPEVEPVWTPDGEGVVFRAPQSTQSIHSQIELFRVSVAGGAPQMLTAAFDRSVVGVGTTIYAVRESATEAPELWRAGIEESERLTTLNAAVDSWRAGRQSVIQWTAPDGLAIEGLLILPVEFTEGDRYPLLVNPGRGQGTRVRNVLANLEAYQPLAAQGYAVLAANVRGSIGYGEAVLTASRNDLAGGELADLIAGVDYVIDLGIADSTRLAVFGSEYSGYTSTRAITETRRFNAAAASFTARDPQATGYEFSDLAVTLSTTAGLDGFGYEDSPLQRAGAVQTPLLIIDAADESSVLADRARQLYRSLTDLGRVAVNVGIDDIGRAGRGAQLDAEIFFRQLRWFDRYLKFGGADFYEFYRIGEWVSGPNDWQMRVRRLDAGTAYSGIVPPDGRYLELALDFRPDPDARRPGGLDLDPTAAVSLVDPDGGQVRPAGMVVHLPGGEILIDDSATAVRVPSPEATSAVSLRLAFVASNAAAAYHLRIAGFAPVRVWGSDER
jgi:dipeptidyl aminopeptidase/acylaminoacyl peptidase